MLKTTEKMEVNLPKLQDLMKRDPHSYQEEFSVQYENYLSHLKMFTFNPSQDSQRFLALTNFIAHVAHLFNATETPHHCLQLLSRLFSSLPSAVRMELCKALILMRNKGHVPTSFFIDEFFKLYSLEDRALRKLIFHFVFRAIQRPLKGDEILKECVLEKLGESSLALRITIELCRRGIWNDDKTINAISALCLSQNTKKSTIAVSFFIGQSKKWIEDEQNEKIEDEQKAIIAAKLAHRVGKKSASRKRAMDRRIKSIKSKKSLDSSFVMSYEPLYSIYNPQRFGEQLYRRLESCRARFEIRLMLMNLVSRLLGIHELSIPQFYPFLGKYLYPKTEEITKILLYAAQSVHAHVDHATVETLIRTIANNFITDANSGEAIAIGLNTVREICVRCPLAMTEDLLRDLANYRNYKHKSASMSAKSLITLFRSVNPKLLHRKDRGKPTCKESTEDNLVVDFVPGAEILPLEEGGLIETDVDEEEKVEKARIVTRTRVFGDEDLQAMKEYRGEESSAEEVEGPPEIVSYSNVIHLHKSRKMTREERIEENAESKKEKTKWRKGGKKSTKKSFRATNREKQKMKNFCMLRPKIMARRKFKLKKSRRR